MGIAQVIAALPRDASRRQLFVPLQLLQQPWQRTGRGVFPAKRRRATRAAIGQLVDEARNHLKTALSLLGTAPRE